VSLSRNSRSRIDVAIWVAATVFGVVVATTTEIGPVVLALSYHHGVHLGDLLAFGLAYAAALGVCRRSA
jgi:hypothetical protein